MAATYVTMQELRDNLGIGTLYSNNDVESVCQTAEDLLNQYLWFDTAPVVAAMVQDNVATLLLANPGIFVTGQSVTIAASGSTYNGTYTLTGTVPWSTGTSNSIPALWWNWAWTNYPNGYSFIQYSKVTADQTFHRVLPYGTATGPDTKTASYATTPAIRQAAARGMPRWRMITVIESQTVGQQECRRKKAAGVCCVTQCFTAAGD